MNPQDKVMRALFILWFAIDAAVWVMVAYILASHVVR
jgi:hypothetical protein